MEKYLYRYKYLPDNEGSLKAISDGTMKFTCPLEFNDPFDCQPEIDRSSINRVFKERLDLIKAAGDKLGFSPAERLQNKGKFKKNILRSIESGKFIDSDLQNIGICSLSKDPLNILMWSHYAKHHTGFMLEFKIPDFRKKHLSIEEHLHRLSSLEVHYRKERPLVAVHSSSQQDTEYEWLKNHFLTKSRDWAYEKEERVIDNKRGPGFHTYDRNLILESVIGGMKMSKESFRKMKEAVNCVNDEHKLKVGCYQAEQVRGEFRIFVPDHPLLAKR